MSDKKTPLDTIREALEAARIAMEGAHHGPHSFLPGQLRSWLEKRALALSALRSMEGSEPVVWMASDGSVLSDQEKRSRSLGNVAEAHTASGHTIPLYAHPPAPAVVELSEEEVERIRAEWVIKHMDTNLDYQGAPMGPVVQAFFRHLASKYHLIPKP